jgi:hypothetical protein
MVEPLLHDAAEVEFLGGGEEGDPGQESKVILKSIGRANAMQGGGGLGLCTHGYSSNVSLG